MEAGYVFSEFEIDQLGFKFKGEDSYKTMECIGSVEEEMETKTTTKKCRGVVTKTRVKGTGNGTLKISGHIPWDIYATAYGMKLDSLIDPQLRGRSRRRSDVHRRCP